MKFISMEAEYIELLACTQELKFVNILVEEIYEVLNIMTDINAEQPSRAGMLAGACVQMLTEARAQSNIHTEVRARMLAKACERVLVEACAWTFLLRVRECTEAHDCIFILKVREYMESHPMTISR